MTSTISSWHPQNGLSYEMVVVSERQQPPHGIPASTMRKWKQKNAKRPGYIPRPPNSFVFFRCDFVRQNAGTGGDLSRRAGIAWKRLSPEGKERYRKRAVEAAEMHRRRYPDYVYQPEPRRCVSRHARHSRPDSSSLKAHSPPNSPDIQTRSARCNRSVSEPLRERPGSPRDAFHPYRRSGVPSPPEVNRDRLRRPSAHRSDSSACEDVLSLSGDVCSPFAFLHHENEGYSKTCAVQPQPKEANLPLQITNKTHNVQHLSPGGLHSTRPADATSAPSPLQTSASEMSLLSPLEAIPSMDSFDFTNVTGSGSSFGPLADTIPGEASLSPLEKILSMMPAPSIYDAHPTQRSLSRLNTTGSTRSFSADSTETPSSVNTPPLEHSALASPDEHLGSDGWLDYSPSCEHVGDPGMTTAIGDSFWVGGNPIQPALASGANFSDNEEWSLLGWDARYDPVGHLQAYEMGVQDLNFLFESTLPTAVVASPSLDAPPDEFSWYFAPIPD